MFENKIVVRNTGAGTTLSGVKVEGFVTPKVTVYPKT